MIINMRITICKFILLNLLPLLSLSLAAQSYFVDKNGILRSSGDNQESAFFGVNYMLPFAHGYRMHKQLGVDMKEAVDQDVYHMARLGFNAYRIHVWDIEISDSDGNLLENEHLDLLDYLISRLKKRNIKIVYTPMAYWGNGYPERDQLLPGFSSRWGKCDITRDEEAICVQEKYLSQFAEHTNPYTGLKIKDDPDVVGFEINNEPCNATSPQETTTYVNRMVNAIRNTGCKKPVFYNVSHNMSNTQAFYRAKIDGGTFQWYPSGLVAGRTRKGNFLPAVDSYPIPFGNIKGFADKAKVIYEFDPADIADPYIYPAMVRSFRSSGFQWITQFGYDPLAIAWANTEYQTHYLNLAYTPGKAISMKIAAEVAKSIPRNSNYGVYPADTVFGDFRVSYREKLSLLNSPEKFFYSNNTTDYPVSPDSLKEIAGCGFSPVVSYDGTGAYFLDKLSDGIWRLEVMPDVVWTKDPYAKASIHKEVATILWNEWEMQINIPGLNTGFTYKGINEGNNIKGKAFENSIKITPGVYLLTRAGTDNAGWTSASDIGNIRIGEFVAPPSRVASFDVIHTPASAITAERDHIVQATVIGPLVPDSVQIFPYNRGSGLWRVQPVTMQPVSGYNWQGTIPSDNIRDGQLKYMIVVYSKGTSRTFPSGLEGNPKDWDFYETSAWTVNVDDPGRYITLFEAGRDYELLEPFHVKGKGYNKRLRAGSYPGEYFCRVTAKEVKSEGELILRLFANDYIGERKDKLEECKNLHIRVGEINGADSLQIGFVTVDGFTYKTTVTAHGGINEISVPLSGLNLTATALVPKGYPSFLPDYFNPPVGNPFNKNDIEFIEIGTGRNNPAEEITIEIQSVRLE